LAAAYRHGEGLTAREAPLDAASKPIRHRALKIFKIGLPGQGCSTLPGYTPLGHGEAEASLGRPARHGPLCVHLRSLAVQSSSLGHSNPTMQVDSATCHLMHKRPDSAISRHDMARIASAS
jgi:hypothetical protein